MSDPGSTPTTLRRIAGRARRTLHRIPLTVAKARRRRHAVVVLGDSHANVFTEAPLRALPVHFDITTVRGATASGLDNPNSQTGASTTFLTKLDALDAATEPPLAIVVMLGEVDCGFVIWWHHQEHGTPVDELLDRAMTNLRLLLRRARRVAPTIFISAPLPTIADAADFGDHANLRRKIDADHTERTALVLDFNRRAAALCEEVGVDFVDLDRSSLGSDGLVSPLLRDPDPHEHHYDQVVYGRVLAKALAPLPPFT